MGLRLKLWGVRGSLPAPHTPLQIESKVLKLIQAYQARRDTGEVIRPQDFLNGVPKWQIGGFGGHTSCFEVQSAKGNLIIDGGSGLRGLGESLCLGPCGIGRGEVHLLFTHFHWDHLMGLPFFTPLFIPGNTIHFYAVQDDLEENIKALFTKPRFPVSFENLAAKIVFHKLNPRQKIIFSDIDVTPYELDHPDPCWGYRISSGGRSYAHCVDSECTRMSTKELGKDLPLYQNVDLMMFDAQYSFIEATERINWGHSSAPVGLDLAMREGIKKVLFIHHDPAATDEKIANIENQSREYYDHLVSDLKKRNLTFHMIDWCFAREGMVIEV